MAIAQAKHDPSMDELLASIRRIISDDEETADGNAPAAPVAADTELTWDSQPKPVAPDPELTWDSPPKSEQASGDLGGLDPDLLPDLIEQSIREAFPTAAQSHWDDTAMEAFQAALVSDEDDEGDADEAPDHDEPVPADWDDELDTDADAFDLSDDLIAGLNDHHLAEDFEDETPAPDLAVDREEIRRLLSERASQSIGTAFDSLARTMEVKPDRTLEDVVQDCLRPLLRAWLDDNLPGLVERMVQHEIDRVARKSR